MAMLPVLIFPNTILKQKALPVEFVDKSVRQLMKDMIDTMYHGNGVGLAAVQVGVLKRVIVIDLQDEDEDKDRSKDFYPLFMANPEITEKSTELCTALEGCLSFPDQRVEVPRSQSIKVKFLDYDNNQKELDASGWLARVIQHEVDHLDGIVVTDYLSSLKRDVVLRKLKKHVKNGL